MKQIKITSVRHSRTTSRITMSASPSAPAESNRPMAPIPRIRMNIICEPPSPAQAWNAEEGVAASAVSAASFQAERRIEKRKCGKFYRNK